MTLHTVFLDFCMTLVQESPSRAAIYADAARGAGTDISEPEMAVLMDRAHRTLPRALESGAFRYTDDWFRAFIEKIFHGDLGLSRGSLPGFEEQLFARFSDARTFVLFPGARECLEALREGGLKTGVISNWSPRLETLLEGLGLRPLLDVVVCSAIERREKPEPEIFERALERAEVRPESALHAGDHPEKDVAAAMAVGMRAVLVDHTQSQEDARSRLPPGVPRVTSLEELSAYLLERSS